MTFEEFVDLTAKMRHAQQVWFSTHDYHYLQESKQLEKAVDKAIADFKEGGVLF